MTYTTTHHKHKLQGKLRQAQDLAAAEGREVVRLRVERDHWRTKAQSAAANAAAVQAPVTLPEITDEDVAEVRAVGGTWQVMTSQMVRTCLSAYRDRLAASLPRWQPIAADDIKPGMLVRGTGDSQPAIPCVELTVLRVSSKALWGSDEWGYLTKNRTWEVDPRTVPADPEPDAAAVEAMARALMERCDFGASWDSLADAARGSYLADALAALTAYRAHIDGSQS